jgi:lactate dehydrogenase-like 2-hydroxyacid dehydrogenase
MTRIAVVHTVTWTPEEWLRLEALGDVRYTPTMPSGEEELLARIGDAEVVVAAAIVPFTSRVIEASPALRLLALLSTGYDTVDLSAARRCGLTVTNVPGYSAHSVAEHAWAMVLHLARRLGEADAHVRRHEFDWSAIEGLQIHGLTAGIIGTGHIGARSAAIAAGLGCRVLAFTQHPSPERARALGVTFVDLPELLAQSDIILVHAALDAGTHGLLNRAAFQGMARRPILVNVARAEIVEMDALLEALESGQLRGVGLDVFWDEPPDWSSAGMQRLLAAENVLLSPHCGMHTDAAFRAGTKLGLDNIEAFLSGHPTNVVS